MKSGPTLPCVLKSELGVRDTRRPKPRSSEAPRKKRKLYQSATTEPETQDRKKVKSILKKSKVESAPKTHDDYLMEQDDAEIDYWEAKLGQRQIAAGDELDDGLDDIFEGLSLPRGQSRLEEVSDHDATSEIEEDSISRDDSVSSTTSYIEDDFANFGEEAEDDHDDDGGYPDSSTTQITRPSIYKPYAQDAPESLSSEPEAKAYIPPALRNKSSTDQSQLKRQIKGLLNRLSAVNIATIVTELVAMYRSNPRGSMNEELSSLVLAIVCDKSSLQDTFVVLHAALVAALYKINGLDFAASFVQTLVEDILAVRASDATTGRKAINLIRFLSELYNLSVISAGLPYDFIRHLTSDLNELNVEILLVIVQSSGMQLRSDDPSSLKDILNLLQSQMKTQYSDEAKAVPLRMKFMVDSLLNLKNNKLAAAEGQQAKELRTKMKKYIGGLTSKTSAEPLRVGLDDIRDVETKGKWWLVGASWKNQETSSKSSNETALPSATATDTQQDKLLALARQHRLNNPIRKQIFVTILSASDYLEAITGVLSLRLKKSQESEISRVLILLVGSEKRYNPFYTHIAKGLSERHGMRISLQFCLWDFLRDCGEDEVGQIGQHRDEENEHNNGAPNVRKIINLGKFFGTLLGMQVLPITVLKTLTFSRLQGLTKRFLEIVFTEMILTVSRNVKKTAEAEQKITEIFRRVKTFDETQKGSALKDGIDWFLRKQVAKTSVVSGRDKELVSDGVETARTVLSL